MSLLNATVGADGVKVPGADDWSIASLGWIFSIAILFLGLAAAFGGAWVEKVGPRKTMATAALFFGGGFLVAALGINTHQLWLVYLGYGVLGGCGLGLGYISPVKTLMSWFPDRPGMATGMAIMGFGGGAFIASPLSVYLMSLFGVAGAFVVLGIVLFHLHDGRRRDRARPARGLEAGGLRCTEAVERPDHHRQRPCRRGAERRGSSGCSGASCSST